MNLEQGKKDFSRIGIAFLVGVSVFYVVFCLIYSILYKVDQQLVTKAYLYLNFGLTFLLAYPLIMLLMTRVEVKEIPKKKIHPGMLIALLPMGYALMIIFNIIGLLINIQIGKLTGKGIVNPIINAIGGMNVWTQVMIVIIIGPILEELIFRKFVIDRVNKYGELLAVMTSALMFGLFHGNMQQCFYAFGVGILLAFVYCKTGKVEYTICCHIFLNFMGSLPGFVIAASGLDVYTIQILVATDINAYMQYVYAHIGSLMAVGLMGIFILLVIVAGIVLMIVFHKKFRFERRETDIRGKAAWSVLFLNVGMALYVIWWIANIVMAQLGYQLSSLLLQLFMRLF